MSQLKSKIRTPTSKMHELLQRLELEMPNDSNLNLVA